MSGDGEASASGDREASTSEDRETLEAHVAHQARAIEQLDEMVREQWSVIEALRREMRALRERVEDMGGEAPEDRPPPHY